MNYNSSKYHSIFDWVFSVSGIICILLFIGVVWLVVRFMNNAEKKDKDVYLPPTNNYETEFGSDNSFWDDIKQEQEQEQENPQREEEPIPPNAVQPTPNMAMMNNECEYTLNENGEYEKDCSKQMSVQNVYVDETALNKIENENKGE